MQYTDHFSPKKTPQSEPIPGESQVQNNAGGFIYQISPWQQLRRFLILGTEGGTFYCSEKVITVENADNVVKCIKEDGSRAIQEILDVSTKGLAAKNDPAIFALALACTFGDAAVKQQAYAQITAVCRTGTHLFTFCQAIQDLRGWSRGLRKGVAKYYEIPVERLGYQLVKYRQRNGWTHRDVMRLCHPSMKTIQHQALYKWAVGKPFEKSVLPEVNRLFDEVHANDGIQNQAEIEVDPAVVAKLPWEALPTEWLKKKEVWEALIPSMPLMALMRNLNKLSVYAGVDSNLAQNTKVVADRFTKDAIMKARLHPLKILEALKTYEAGHGHKGSLTWTPAPMIIEALASAFYHAFGSIEPTGKAFCIGADVSGSMGIQISGSFLCCREVMAALLMTIVRTESRYEIIAFDTKPKLLPITPQMSLGEVMRLCNTGTFGGTDCSLPIIHAAAHRKEVDVFQIITDSETWAGKMHPSQAIKEYRNRMQRKAKMVVWGMTATGFSIADPNDDGMLDVVGFDSSVPELIRNFIT